jgi:hypothetical protein
VISHSRGGDVADTCTLHRAQRAIVVAEEALTKHVMDSSPKLAIVYSRIRPKDVVPASLKERARLVTRTVSVFNKTAEQFLKHLLPMIHRQR